jgi:hypothetical protein
MKDIQIIVTKKVASVEGTPIIVCGNSDYTLSFTFDDEWSNEQNKVARFNYSKNGLKRHIDEPIKNNTCKVPKLLGIGLVKVGVYAGDLKTTTEAKIKCHKLILCDDADTMDEPFKNLYEELKKEVTDLEKDTIKELDVVNLSTCESGVYLTSTIRYNKAVISQPFTEMIPAKALLIVEKTVIGTSFEWLSSAYILAGLSNAYGEFENEFVKYEFSSFATKDYVSQAIGKLESGTIKYLKDVNIWELSEGIYYLNGTCWLHSSRAWRIPLTIGVFVVIQKMGSGVRYIRLFNGTSIEWQGIECGYTDGTVDNSYYYNVLDTSSGYTKKEVDTLLETLKTELQGDIEDISALVGGAE